MSEMEIQFSPSTPKSIDLSGETDQNYSVKNKNTFLHIDDEDQVDLSAMGRVVSAPQPECRPYRIRSDEPMKIKRVGGNESSMIGTEGWGSGACMLEEADGSGAPGAWNFDRVATEDRLKAGNIGHTISSLSFNEMNFTHMSTEIGFPDKHRSEGKVQFEEKDTLATIQDMFNKMYSQKTLTSKNSFIHYNDQQEEQPNLMKFSSAPLPDIPFKASSTIVPMPPVPESSIQENFPSGKTSLSGSTSEATGSTAGIDENLDKNFKGKVEYIEIHRPWEQGARVPLYPNIGKTRPPPGMKFLCTFVIGIHECQQFTVSRRIIGRGGENMKFISQLCPGTKLRLRGKGSGFRERDTNLESDVPLQVNLSSPFKEEYEIAKREVASLLNNIYRDYRRLFQREIRVKLNEHPKNPK